MTRKRHDSFNQPTNQPTSQPTFLPTFLFFACCLLILFPGSADAVEYQFPWYGIQGEGGYYIENTTLYYPGVDLVEVSNARSVVLWGATFPYLADNPDDIDDHDYFELYCDNVDEKKLDIAQQYIIAKGYNKVNAIIKVRTGQSDGSANLCGSEDEKPDWSHICEGEWGGNQLTSATPKDIIDTPDCCSPPPDGVFLPGTYSQNLLDYTATLANGCGGSYGNKNYSFENECDLHWAGLGTAVGCIPDGPYHAKGKYPFTSLDDAEDYGRHLAHHYMQAYFSFIEGLEEELPDDHFGYPFGIANLNLGLMIGRWFAGDGTEDALVEKAMRFTNNITLKSRAA